MSRIASSRHRAFWLLTASMVVAPGVLAGAQTAETTDAPQTVRIVSSEVEISRDVADLRLELDDGRSIEFEIRDGAAWIDGERIGVAGHGEALDRSWRELLNGAVDTPVDRLASLLVEWDAPGGAPGDRLDSALETLLGAGAQTARAAVPAQTAAGADDPENWASDSLARLNDRISELESQLQEARSERRAPRAVRVDRRSDDGWLARPFRRITNGIANIVSLLAVYAVLVGIGFAVVFFGKRYLEGVADTARHNTMRSGLVGLAASFLVVPAFFLGAIALTISIVGIPVLLAWLPLFPVAVILAAILGYLGVAHAAGESLAERRFNGGELFKRANSYYYILTGVGLLIALFIAAHIVHMAGPWLDFIHGLLMFLAVVLTWAAFTIGFGAVLLSRGGTRPRVTRPGEPDIDVDPVFEEETHV